MGEFCRGLDILAVSLRPQPDVTLISIAADDLLRIVIDVSNEVSNGGIDTHHAPTLPRLSGVEFLNRVPQDRLAFTTPGAHVATRLWNNQWLNHSMAVPPVAAPPPPRPTSRSLRQPALP